MVPWKLNAKTADLGHFLVTWGIQKYLMQSHQHPIRLGCWEGATWVSCQLPFHHSSSGAPTQPPQSDSCLEPNKRRKQWLGMPVKNHEKAPHVGSPRYPHSPLFFEVRTGSRSLRRWISVSTLLQFGAPSTPTQRLLLEVKWLGTDFVAIAS